MVTLIVLSYIVTCFVDRANGYLYCIILYNVVEFDGMENGNTYCTVLYCNLFCRQVRANGYFYCTVQYCIGQMVTLIVMFNIVTCFVDR